MSRQPARNILLADELELARGQSRRREAANVCASRLAHRLGVGVDLIHVESQFVHAVEWPQYKPLIDKYLADQKAQLEAHARALKVPARAIVREGDPASEILSLAGRRSGYELVVQGTHGRKGFSRLVLGSVAEEVIRRARVPVLTVGPHAQARAKDFLARKRFKILVPTRLTANSEAAEAYAIDLAKRLDATVVFFHSLREALHPTLQIAALSPDPPATVRELFEELAEAAVEKLRSRVRQAAKRGVKASFQLDRETVKATDAALKAVKTTEASLVVMGTHGRTLASSAFFGRTARGVILGAKVPVVTFH